MVQTMKWAPGSDLISCYSLSCLLTHSVPAKQSLLMLLKPVTSQECLHLSTFLLLVFPQIVTLRSCPIILFKISPIPNSIFFIIQFQFPPCNLSISDKTDILFYLLMSLLSVSPHQNKSSMMVTFFVFFIIRRFLVLVTVSDMQ